MDDTTNDGAPPPGAAAEQAQALLDRAMQLREQGRPDLAHPLYDDVIARLTDAPGYASGVTAIQALLGKATLLAAEGRSDAELAVVDQIVVQYDRLVTMLGDGQQPAAVLRAHVANALRLKGDMCEDAEQLDRAVETYDALVTRFGDDDDPAIRGRVATAMLGNAGCLTRLNRAGEAFTAYGEVVGRFGAADELALGVVVAQAIYGQADMIDAGESPEPVLLLCDELVGHHDRLVTVAGEAAEMPVELRRCTAAALNLRAGVLDGGGQHDEAVASHDEVVRRFGDASESALGEQVAWALADKGVTLGERLDRPDEALAAYDEVVARFGEAQDPAFVPPTMIARHNRGLVLMGLERFDEAVAAFDDIVARHDTDTDVLGRQEVFVALADKGAALVDAERPAEVIALWDELARRYSLLTSPTEEEPEGQMDEPTAAHVHVAAARAVHNHATALGQLGRTEEQMWAYDNLVAFHDNLAALAGGLPPDGVRRQAALVLRSKAAILYELGRHDEELDVYDGIVRRFGDASGPHLRECVVSALLDKAQTLFANLDRPDEALAANDEVVARFGDADDAESCTDVANALLNRADILGAQGRVAEALAVYDDVVARYDRLVATADWGAEPPGGLREWVASALDAKGELLRKQGQLDQALAVFAQADARFGDDPDPDVQAATAAGRNVTTPQT